MKKNGFTLIELLSVIIILAVIALISTPIVLKIVENTKMKAIENSCYGVIFGAKYVYTKSLMTDTIIKNGSVTTLSLSGEKPVTGIWTMNTGSNAGIIIKDVTFASMPDYVCTNENTENNKVVCSKGDVEITTIDAQNVSYTNSEYTTCTNIECALNELYN